MKITTLFTVIALFVAACSTDSFPTSTKVTDTTVFGVTLSEPQPVIGETLFVSLAAYITPSDRSDFTVYWNINNLTKSGNTTFSLDLSQNSLDELLTKDQKDTLEQTGKVSLLITARLTSIYPEKHSNINSVEIPFTLYKKAPAKRLQNPSIKTVECTNLTPDNESGEPLHYTVPTDTAKVVCSVDTSDIIADNDAEQRMFMLGWMIGWDGKEQTIPVYTRDSNSITILPPQQGGHFAEEDMTLFLLIKSEPAYTRPILADFEEIHFSFKK